MKLKHLAYFLNRLEEKGFGEVQLFTDELVSDINPDDLTNWFELNLIGVSIEDLQNIFTFHPLENANITGEFGLPVVSIEEQVELEDPFKIRNQVPKTKFTV